MTGTTAGPCPAWHSGRGAAATVGSRWGSGRCPAGSWQGWVQGSGAEPLIRPEPSRRVQQEQMEKEKAEEERRAALRLAHASDVRRQIQDRQQQLAQERAAAFEECQRLQEEARQRSQRIAQLKQQKMQELR